MLSTMHVCSTRVGSPKSRFCRDCERVDVAAIDARVSKRQIHPSAATVRAMANRTLLRQMYTRNG